MRKSLLIAAMAGLAFVGCTESELDQTVSTQQAIKFNVPVVRSNTKAATEVGEVYRNDLSFRVFGHYYDANYTNFANGVKYIDEAEATFRDGKNTWYPSKNGIDYYWPKNGTLTFIAYSPANQDLVDKTDVRASGLTIINYVVDNESPNNDMEDLMFSERAYNKKFSNQDSNFAGESDYDGVDLQFRHALASIVFNARQDKVYPGTTIKIKGITLSNVASTGTFNQNLNDQNGATTKTDKLDSGSSNSSASWVTLNNNKVEYKVDLTTTALNNTDTDFQKPYWPCTNSFEAPGFFGGDKNYFRNTDLLLIPQ